MSMGNVTAEPDANRAIRDGAGLVDRSARGKLTLGGTDRVSFLHAVTTNDVVHLSVGRGCYSALLTPQGRMRADMRIYMLEDALLLDLEPQLAGLVAQKLDQMVFTEDVQIRDVTLAFGWIGVYGARAAAVIGAVLGNEDELRALDLLAYANRFVEGETLRVVRSDYIGTDGFEILIPVGLLAAVRARLVAAGGQIVPAEALETARIEAGTPVFGIDLDEDIIPLEAGIEARAISFEKGCYPGQEVIVRVLHRGHGRVARKLVGLRVAADVAPARGDRISAGGRDVGFVTSAARSPAAGSIIALGYVHRDFIEPGTNVSIMAGGGPLSAVVAALPFYSAVRQR